MTTAKDEVRGILERLPDGASLDDIQYHIHVCQKVQRGREDVRRGRLVDQDEIECRMSKWLDASDRR